MKKIFEKIKEKKNIICGVIFVAIIAFFSFSEAPKTLQNDTYYTVSIGNLIMENGIDMKDHFSWHEDLPYTYPHWLYDVFMSIIYNVGNWDGIYISVCVMSIILGLSIYIVNKKLNKNQVISFCVTIGAMYLLKDYIAARAQLATFIIYVWVIYFIEKFIETGKIKYAIPLVLIPIAIANLHVAVWPFYFILYLPYIGEYLLSCLSELVFYDKAQRFFMKRKVEYLERIEKQGQKNVGEKLQKAKDKLKEMNEKASRVKIRRNQNQKKAYKIKIVKEKNVKYLIIIMIICAFTGLLTPLGDVPYTYLYKTMIGNTTQNINEHLPMTLVSNTNALCMIILFLAVLMFTKTRIRLRDLFFTGGLCYLMLSSSRQITMFAIVGTLIFTRLVTQMFEEYNYDYNKLIKVVMTPVVSVFLIVLVVFVSYKQAIPKKDSKFVSEKSYPVKACDYILENIDLGKARFYNEYNYGSYMLFRGIPVFIDSRADLYAPEFNKKEDIFMDFINTSSVATFYEDTFKKYNITHVITYKDSKVSMIIKKSHDENYEELYKDDNFVIYKRLNAEVEK